LTIFNGKEFEEWSKKNVMVIAGLYFHLKAFPPGPEINDATEQSACKSAKAAHSDERANTRASLDRIAAGHSMMEDI
jgi:hypothetical protein